MSKEPQGEQPEKDSWVAFERAVDAAVKGGPKPMPKTEKPKKEKSAQKRATSSSLGGKS